jgi:hypothetical protein
VWLHFPCSSLIFAVNFLNSRQLSVSLLAENFDWNGDLTILFSVVLSGLETDHWALRFAVQYNILFAQQDSGGVSLPVLETSSIVPGRHFGQFWLTLHQ